jgi:hypothetical protein
VSPVEWVGVVSLLYLLACALQYRYINNIYFDIPNRSEVCQTGTPQPMHQLYALDVILQEHRPFGEPMTGSLGTKRFWHLAYHMVAPLVLLVLCDSMGCSTYCIDELPCMQCSACLVSSRPQPKPEVQHRFCQLQLLHTMHDDPGTNL